MNEQQSNVMLINVDPLAFTVPTQIDKTRFMVNVLHKDDEGGMFGILIINTNPVLEFTFYRNDKYTHVDEKINKAMNMMKEYIRQTLKINGEKVKSVDTGYMFGQELSINMGMDIVKNGPDGKPMVDENGEIIKKHIEVNKKLN